MSEPAAERTLAIFKPDLVAKAKHGVVLQRILDEGFRVLGLRQIHLSRAQAEGFYAVHEARPFFDELCTFMSRGPVVVLALERNEAVTHWRNVIGATNPKNAAPGTIRAQFGGDVAENAVHGSDSPENGKIEVAYFFAENELLG